MTTAGAPPTALICEDDPQLGAALSDTVTGLFGFHVAETSGSGANAVAAAARLRPDLVVIDLALSGDLGLKVVRALLKASPGSAVVAVVPPPFGGLRATAVHSGAMDLVELSDLRPLRRCLEQRWMRLDVGEVFPCCPGLVECAHRRRPVRPVPGPRPHGASGS